VRGTQAHFLAEAGLEDAFDHLRANPARFTSPPATLTPLTGLSGPGPRFAAVGTYAVRYQDAGAHTLLVVAEGQTADGNARRTVRALFSRAFNSRYAILVDGDLRISGNPTVSGKCGGVHANFDPTISGNPTVTGLATASGTYAVSGTPTVGEGNGGGRPPQPVPEIDPAAFLAAALAEVEEGRLAANQVFQLRADGVVLDGVGNTVTTVTSGESFNGWRFTAGSPITWQVSGNASDGFY
jgi:hypothetical protein